MPPRPLPHRPVGIRLLGVGAVLTCLTGVAVAAVDVPRDQARRPAPPAAAPAAAATPDMAALPTASPPKRTKHHEPVRRRASKPEAAPAATRLSTSWGIDVSWPQCHGGLPELDTGFVVVGVNGGRPFTTNPCLAEQVGYAKRHTGYAAYINLDAPRTGDPAAYGRRVALDGLARARAAGLRTSVLWLDVEVVNHWTRDYATNVAVIAGAVRALESRHVTAGIYSSNLMWLEITGGVDPRTPVWLATTVTDYRDLEPLCARGLGGRPAVMGQYVATTGTQLIDVNVLCEDALPEAVGMFAAGHG